MVIDAAGNRYQRYSAFIRLSMDSPLLRHVLPVLRMAWVRSAFNRFYDLLDHPQVSVEFTRVRACSDETRRCFRRGRDAIAGLAILYVLIWNLATLPGRPVTLAEWYRLPGEMFGLEQSWYMFAPFPLKDDGWYVIPGKLRHGRVVDLFRGGGEVTWMKPASVSQTYPDYRWRKYMMNLIYMPNHHRSYLEYLCRDWNDRHGPDVGLEELVMVFVHEKTLPNYEYSPPGTFLLASHHCAAQEQ